MSTSKTVPTPLASQKNGLTEDTAREDIFEDRAIDKMAKILEILDKVVRSIKAKLCPKTQLSLYSCHGCRQEGPASISWDTPPHGRHSKQWIARTCEALKKLL